jgi:predicted dehydrogenase
MRIGIVGTGWGTRVQVPAFQAAGLEIVGIAAQNEAKTRQEAERLGVPAFASWRALLASDVDLISIVTPPATHRELAVAALEAGKHVLCEKPTALNAAEARAMLAAAQSRPGQIALIDHELRFLPVWQAARAAVQAGEIGIMRHVVSSIVQPSRADMTRPWSWWSDKDQGGGVWGAIGSHQLDTLRFVCGEIAAVSGTLETFIAERPFADSTRAVTSDDFAAAQLRFADGGFGSVVMSLVSAVSETDTLTIHGDAGALRVEGSGRLLVARRGGEWQERTPDRSVAIPATVQGTFPIATVYLGHALRAYADGDQTALAPGATFADGLRIQQLLDALHQSAAANSAWVTLAE